MDTVSVYDAKARFSELVDRAQAGRATTITKRGRVVARLVPAGDEDERPWMTLRGRGRWVDNPFAPVVEERDVEVLKRPAKARTRRS